MKALRQITCLLLLVSGAASASEERRLRLTGGIGASSVTGPGGTAVGFGPALGVSYALSERFAIGTVFTQSFALANGISPFYSRFELVLSAALTGRLIASRNATVSVDSKPIFQTVSATTDGYRAKLKGNQYFFTGSTTVYPYAGFGLEFGYEWSAANGLGYEVNLGVDLVSNTVRTIFPFGASFVIMFWP
jgi:hypothetical protein